MPTLTIELAAHDAQRAFNLRRWEELMDDPELARIEGRIETDRHGRAIWHPVPDITHARLQTEIGFALRDLMCHGQVITICPISTADGVKAADVAWVSRERLAELGNRSCFPDAPEICVEVVSPRNTKAEIDEKVALYFNAGAKEVWLCSAVGEMSFLSARGKLAKSSSVCPNFPKKVVLS